MFKKKKTTVMADELIKQASTKLLSWLLGIVAGLMLTGLAGGFKFYSDWKADEAAEDEAKYQQEAIMFDSPEQKEQIKDHVVEAPSALEQHLKTERDRDFQKEVLKQLQHLSHIDTLNADQMFQIKNELRQLKKN